VGFERSPDTWMSRRRTSVKRCKREDDGVRGTYGYELECYLKDLPATVCWVDELPAAAAAVDIHDCLYVCIVMAATPHVHRQYGHVWPRRKSLCGVSLSPRGTRRIVRFGGKRTGNVSPPFRQPPDRQRTAILLLFVSKPTRRHRHLRTVLPVLLQTETSRNKTAGHGERLSHRWFKRTQGQNFKI
jgi:hypothetical protein